MIGLFLGTSDFPKKILNKIRKKRIKYFIVDLTNNRSFKKDKKVLFAGKIDKPKISRLRLDLKGIYYIPRIVKAAKLGDAAILKELIKILDENRIKVIKSNFYNP